MTPLLQVRAVSLRFGGLQVLGGVDLDVFEHQIVGLIGPNGAGKTSFFNCLTGIYTPQHGVVEFGGEDISRLSTHQRAQLGLGRSWQNLGVVRDLTVFDNVMLALHQRAGYSVWSGLLGLPASLEQERSLRRDAEEILDYLELRPYAAERVGDLPYGTQKQCDLAMALATDPVALLLDEPSSGMSPEEAHQLGGTLRRLRDSLRLTILMIEHHVPLVVETCDYVYVLNFGEVLAAGKPEQIKRHPEVMSAYLGDDVEVADASA